MNMEITLLSLKCYISTLSLINECLLNKMLYTMQFIVTALNFIVCYFSKFMYNFNEYDEIIHRNVFYNKEVSKE